MSKMINTIIRRNSGKENTPLNLKAGFSVILSMIVMMLLVVPSCKKQPVNDFSGANSKITGIANKWIMSQAIENGRDITSNYNTYQLDLSKNGYANLSVRYSNSGVRDEFTTSGSWKYNRENSHLTLNFVNDTADGIFTILKLQPNEMWLLRNDGRSELHYTLR